MLKPLRFLLEWLAALLWIALFRSLSFDRASQLGGWIGRTLGPRLAVTKIAKRNLTLVYPQKSAVEHQAIILDMWDNLGRTLAEFPHLPYLSPEAVNRIVCDQKGADIIHDLVKKNAPCIIVSAHYGNWELAPKMAAHYGLLLSLVFRPANNPLTNRLILKLRDHYARMHMGKGATEGRAIIKTLRDKHALGMLLDQKIRSGIEIDFLGQKTLAAGAAASLARQFDCPIVMARIKRLGRSARFQLEVSPPLTYSVSSDKQADIRHITQRIYDMFTAWIHDAPEQWFWVHKRWEKSLYEHLP